MFPNASAKPLIIPPAIAGEQAAALSRGSEAICLEAKLIFSLDRKWKVMQAALMFNVVTFWVSAERPQTGGSTVNQMLSDHHRSRFDI